MQQNTTDLPLLPIYTYQLLFNVENKNRLPKYAGSAWRGAFGHALKKTVCVVRDTPCADCMLKNACAYSYIFETPPPADANKMRKYTASPHPFVLQFPKRTELQENQYALNMTLFGNGARYFPYLVHAMQKAGEEGIGSSRQIFQLDSIKQTDSVGMEQIIYQNGNLHQQLNQLQQALPLMPDEIKINIHTPMRIKQLGHNLNPHTFNFSALFGNLLRRISMLTYFHTDSALETNFAELSQRAKQIDFKHKALHWYDWKRYSSRQKTEMNMGGVIGQLQLDTYELEDFWPYLWMGQWTHAGKATSMGLGHYSIDMTSLS